MIGVINYGSGNLGSVMNALEKLGVSGYFIKNESDFYEHDYEKIIFPGDGHFAKSMQCLKESNLTNALKAWIEADKPFLGICIGLQLLFESSEEAPPRDGREVRGLSLIKGRVLRFPGRKVPQIGWNNTTFKRTSKLFKGLKEAPFFYYIHSYYALPDDESVVAAEADYYLRFCAAVEKGNMAAVQFHPEKSGEQGLRLLANWLK